MGKESCVFSSAMNVIFLLVFLSILASVSGQLSVERMGLLEFKKSVYDPNGILKSWNAANFNHCSWFGVSCNSNLRISGIRIGGNFSIAPSCILTSELALHTFGIRRTCPDSSEISGTLRGRLSPVIGKFKEIRVLALPFNELVGEIPVEIWGLDSLEVLDLEGNYFDGNFSGYNFTQLRKLRVLNLGLNRIFGLFPDSLSQCRGLRILNLAGNRIVGVIPRYVGSFLRLRVVNLSFNWLVGYVPSSFGFGCGKLEHLDLSGNFLSGEIPHALGNCRRLRTLLLSSNAFCGIIPSELGRLQRLEVLDVSKNILKGPLPAKLGRCTNLSVLVLSTHDNACPRKRHPSGEVLSCGLPGLASDKYNSFEGSIPDEITALVKLKVIWAPGANLHGNLPSIWRSCNSLKMLNLAQNFLTGNMSGLLAGCKNLEYLNLSYNMLTSTLGENLHIPCLTMFDVNKNAFSSPVPSFNTNICCHMPSFKTKLPLITPSVVYFSYFSYKVLYDSHPFFCRFSSASMPVQLMHHQTSNRPEMHLPGKSDQRHKSGTCNRLSVPVIASIVCASAIVAVFFAFLALFCYAKRRRLDSRIDISASPYAERVTVFNDIGLPLTYEIIVGATENFSRRNCIGSGGFGSTYRAEVAPGNTVAVKRLTAERHQGTVQFRAEITTLGRIRHPNLITLIGYYANEAEMFLIYNYLPGGNLDRFIQERETRAFDWRTFHKIALHIASALSYLHDGCSPCILHRDIKPSNILLDNDNNAYLSDFGLSKILTTAQNDGNTCCIAGTYGYIAPEYALTGRVSDKTDVYSYGVVLLELMSDKRALDPSFHSHEDGFNIVSWACMLLDQGRAGDVFTSLLRNSTPRDSLVKMLHIAILCTVELLDARPTMKQVVDRLMQIQPHIN